MDEVSSSPIILKYSKIYDKNPRSRVFAPLAESYRKMGMVDRAINLLKKGIKHNPSYTMGYLGLAFCYYDMEKYSLAYTILSPLISVHRDNLRMQKLFAEICYKISNYDEALETYKYLLFIHPKDKFIAKMVLELENREGAPSVFVDQSKEQKGTEGLFAVEKLSVEPTEVGDDADEWTQVDLLDGEQEEKRVENREKEESALDQWTTRTHYDSAINIDNNNDDSNDNANNFNDKVDESNEADDVKVDLKMDDGDAEQEVVPVKSEETPVITHTLVDLYCSQGHIDKAVTILEKILVLNPDDSRTIQKLEEIRKLIPKEEVDEDEGRNELMNLFDKKFVAQSGEKNQGRGKEIVEKKMQLFLDALKVQAKEFNNK